MELLNILIDPNTLPFLLLAVVISLLILLIALFLTNRRLNRLLLGKDAKSLEDTLRTLIDHTHSIEAKNREQDAWLADIHERLRGSIRGIETVRFNPFKGTGDGGNQSFATAFVNEKGNGVVLSSLYSRERVSVFSKPIKSFQSEFSLSEEEKEVLEKAKAIVAEK